MVSASAQAPPIAASPPVWHRFVAGTASGAALVAVGHPLDTLRVRAQMSPPRTRLVSLLRALLRESGVRGLYRGFGPPLLLTGTVNTVLWGSTFATTDALAANGWGSPSSRAVVAAVPASFVSSLIVAPMEGLKTRQQTSRGVPLARLVGDVLRREGVRGLYRGWSAVIGARTTGGWAYFGGNAMCLEHLAVWAPPGDSVVARTRNVLIAGGCAGIAFWSVSMPIDTIKTRVMAADSAYSGPIACARALYTEGGVRGFYRGFSAALLRAFPANAAAFTAFDVATRLLAS